MPILSHCLHHALLASGSLVCLLFLGSCSSINQDANSKASLAYRTEILNYSQRYSYLIEPFDEEAFRSNLHAYWSGTRQGEVDEKLISQISNGIGRLTADGNTTFDRDLDDLKSESNERLKTRLLAYDYQVRGRKGALEELLKKAREAGNADCYAFSSLAFVDEWVETAKLIHGPGMDYDGSSGDAFSSFVTIRKALFPENYEKFGEFINSPN